MTLSENGFTGLIAISEIAPTELHRLDSFTSGRDELDQFLTQQAVALHGDHLSHTSCLFHTDFPSLVGFITLSNDAIPLNQTEVGELGLAYAVSLTSYPAIKIGRLAVHSELKRQGIGRRILDLAVGEITGQATITASRLLITDAVNDKDILTFYASMGFEESLWATSQSKNHGRAKERATIKMIRDIYHY